MRVFFKKGLSKKPPLIAVITTTQSPHLESYFYFIRKNSINYGDIYVLDIFSKAPFRNELTWRVYTDLRTNFYRKIQNGFLKELFFNNQIKKLDFIEIECKPNVSFLHKPSELFQILKTFTLTEFKSAGIKETSYSESIINTINYASTSVFNFLNLYKLNKRSVFLIFNGRHPLEFSSRLTLSKLGFKNLIFHECNNFKYKVYFTNFQIHNLSSYYRLILEYRKNNNSIHKKWLALNNLNFNDVINKKYITFFTSSLDEYSFAYEKPINQPLLIHKILQELSNLPIKIRVHPNTKNKSIDDINYWNYYKKRYPEIFINYDEHVSSYQLIRESFFTISIGSSIGPESLILGTNHLLCGNQHLYNKIPGFYRCDENNFIQKITNLYQRRNNLKEINYHTKEFSAASLLFNKDIGISIPLSFFGRYPFKEGKKYF